MDGGVRQAASEWRAIDLISPLIRFSFPRKPLKPVKKQYSFSNDELILPNFFMFIDFTLLTTAMRSACERKC